MDKFWQKLLEGLDVWLMKDIGGDKDDNVDSGIFEWMFPLCDIDIAEL